MVQNIKNTNERAVWFNTEDTVHGSFGNTYRIDNKIKRIVVFIFLGWYALLVYSRDTTYISKTSAHEQAREIVKERLPMNILIDKLVFSKPLSNFEELRTSNFLVHV